MNHSSRHSIMVVDDEPIVGKRLKRLLEREGYAVETFTRGSQALEGLGRNRYDVIITDIMMGNVDGMMILEYVKSNYPDIPVIIITGYGKKEIAEEAYRKGVHSFIIKPFRIDELKAVVKEALSGADKD
ncbi:MAG: response regulator [Nitrospiraceae bacterium]|nr:MAG: response regulator [Nitrospiraceae bacterium]